MTRPAFPRSLLAVLMVLGLAGTAEAQSIDVVQKGASMQMDAVGHRFSIPLPDWLSAAERLSPDVLGNVEHNTYVDAQQAFVEFFPEGQSVSNWTTTYAARVTLDATRSLADYRKATIFGYSQTCNDKLVGSFSLGEDTAETLAPLVYVCGAYKDTVTSGRGQGQVLLAVFRKTDRGVGMVYEEWKGPIFDPSNLATWPVSREALQARAADLAGNTRLAAIAGS